MILIFRKVEELALFERKFSRIIYVPTVDSRTDANGGNRVTMNYRIPFQRPEIDKKRLLNNRLTCLAL